MIPVQDVIPSRTPPRMTLAVVLLLGAIALIVWWLPQSSARPLILSYGLVPAHVSWTTAVCALFLHQGLWDAAANMAALWIFGDNIEDRLGRWRFGALMLLGGVAGNLAAARIDPTMTTAIVGAGAAVGAVVGAHMVLLPSARILVLVPDWRGYDLVEIPGLIVVAFWLLAVSVTAAARPLPDAGASMLLAAQLVGIALGAGGARLLARPERRRCEWWNVPAGHSPPVRRRTSRDTSASSVSNASN